jgi:preprotein translocase subunit SecG
MYTLLIVLIIMVCILLVMVVLVQNSKGGGLAANFGGSNQIMGVRRTADFLEKATWTLAGALLVFSILASWVIEKPGDAVKSRIEGQSTTTAADEGLPSIPAGLPDENAGGDK